MKIFYLVIIILPLLLESCKGCKTTPNTSDTTPPVIDWTVQNKTTGTDTKLTGNANYSAKYGDLLQIIACADDDGGLKQLEHYTNSSYSCAKGNIGQTTGPGLIVPSTISLGLDVDGKAWNRYCAIMTMNLNFSCSSGFNFSSGNAVAFLKGINYGGVSASASLSINVTR